MAHRVPTIAAVLVACALGTAWQAHAGGLIVMEPGPVDFSNALGGYSTAGGRTLQMVVPGSHPWFVADDFPASQYSISCDTPYILTRDADGEHRVCRIAQAPVVTSDFIATLKTIGYDYSISYPFKDALNNRALIFWSDGGAARGMAPAHQGFARITNVPWNDQFAPAARCDDQGSGCVWRYFEHGDAMGAFINRFSLQDRANSARIYQQIGVGTDGRVIVGASIVIDPWLSDPNPHIDAQSDKIAVSATVAPSPPPSPEAVSTNGAIPFDQEAFCRQPSRDGTPRSPLWTQNCLAKSSGR